MKHLFRNYLFAILVIVLCGKFQQAFAQQMQFPPLPIDKNVRIGKLDNGLTYYIRHNKLPEHRAEFYIAQKVGSILEEPQQRGLAHFLEHMKNFLVVYNFVIFGILFLSSIMSYEGNYIDGLMSRKESIYNLLRAKYTVYSIAILIPFILMIPAMITKKVAVMSCVSWAVFSVGFVYFCLFQMAVYNNRTINLSVRMTGRNVGTGLQNLIAGASFGVPLILNVVLKALIGQETASCYYCSAQ